jgi:hypothetical protein
MNFAAGRGNFVGRRVMSEGRGAKSVGRLLLLRFLRFTFYALRFTLYVSRFTFYVFADFAY